MESYMHRIFNARRETMYAGEQTPANSCDNLKLAFGSIDDPGDDSN